MLALQLRTPAMTKQSYKAGLYDIIKENYGAKHQRAAKTCIHIFRVLTQETQPRGYAAITLKELSQLCGRATSTISIHLNKLCQLGLVQKRNGGRGPTGRFLPNTYYI